MYDKYWFCPDGKHKITGTKYDEGWFDKNWINVDTWTKYDIYHFDRNRKHEITWAIFDDDWYDRDWYDKNGFDRDWEYQETWLLYDNEWFNQKWYDRRWVYKTTWILYDKDWYDKDWYDGDWYDKNGFDIYYFNHKGINKYTWKFSDRDWYNKNWFNDQGYDRDWYDKDWFNDQGYDRDWYDKKWKPFFNRSFFECDLLSNQHNIKEKGNEIEYEYNQSLNLFEEKKHEFYSMNPEDRYVAHDDLAILNYLRVKDNNSINYFEAINNPYFFFWTNAGDHTYISSHNIRIDRKIIPYTDITAKNLRYNEDCWENKYSLSIKWGNLLGIDPIVWAKKYLDISVVSYRDQGNERMMEKWLDSKEIILSKNNSSQEKWSLNEAKEHTVLGDISALLRKEQDEIMRAPIDGVTLITWTAGSGKTNVLLHRVDYLLAEHPKRFNQNNIAFFCFNVSLKKYISDMIKERFPQVLNYNISDWEKEMLDKYLHLQSIKYDKDIVVNINDFLNKFIEKKLDMQKIIVPKEMNIYGDERVLLSIDWKKVLENIVWEKQILYDQNDMYFLLYFLGNINIDKDILKKTVIEIEEKLDSTSKEKIEIKRKKYQFTVSLSFMWKKMIYLHTTKKNNAKFEIHRPNYEHILIDEVQDLFPIQIQIINCFHNNSMTLAWDPTQLLNNNQIERLEEFFGIKINHRYNLTLSHRISYETAMFANEIIRWEKNVINVENVPFYWDKPLITQCFNDKKSLQQLLSDIQNIKEKYPKSSVCVVLPKKDMIDQISCFLKENNVNAYKAYHNDWDFNKKIHVTNYHQIKWLEFDYVFILGLENFDVWGWKKRSNKRNIFYTMATRAKKRLYINYVWEMPNLIKDINDNTYEFKII